MFDEDNIHSLKLLEDRSKAPAHVRQREITPLEEQQATALRKKYMQYGKIKLSKYYERDYGKPLSSWKIQGVIKAKNLYRRPVKNAKIQRKRQAAKKRKRITELKLNQLSWYQKKAGYIICLDTVVI